MSCTFKWLCFLRFWPGDFLMSSFVLNGEPFDDFLLVPDFVFLSPLFCRNSCGSIKDPPLLKLGGDTMPTKFVCLLLSAWFWIESAYFWLWCVAWWDSFFYWTFNNWFSYSSSVFWWNISRLSAAQNALTTFDFWVWSRWKEFKFDSLFLLPFL